MNLPEEFFIEAVLRVAFKSQKQKPDNSCGCDCDTRRRGLRCRPESDTLHTR